MPRRRPAHLELFVYWRCDGVDAAAAEAALSAMHDRLRVQRAGLVARRHLRVDDAVGAGGADGGDAPAHPGNAASAAREVTWMETYGRVDAGLSAQDRDAIEAEAAATLTPWCRGLRHREVFELRG